MTMDTFYPQHTEQSLETLEITPKVRSPWRRFFARNFDLFLYNMLWTLFITTVMNVNILVRVPAARLFDTFVSFLLMLLIEPFLLAFLGTTPGKWILGLEVVDQDGLFLSVSEALSRTWTVFWSGFGLSIPIYSFIRQWKSYNACKTGETLEWEHESVLVQKDEKNWRTITYIGVNASLFIVLVLVLQMASLPKNRGDLTIAEFSENYNRLSEYYKIDSSHVLDESGKWVKREYDGSVIVFGSDIDLPSFEFTESNGIMTGLRFELELTNYDGFIPSYQNEMILSILSFVGAQKGERLILGDINEVVEKMTTNELADFEYKLRGMAIKNEIEYSGYHETSSFGMFWPIEGVDKYFKFDFQIVK